MHDVMNRSVNAAAATLYIYKDMFYIFMGQFRFLKLSKYKAKIQQNLPEKKLPANESSSAPFEPAIKNIANR